MNAYNKYYYSNSIIYLQYTVLINNHSYACNILKKQFFMHGLSTAKIWWSYQGDKAIIQLLEYMNHVKNTVA